MRNADPNETEDSMFKTEGSEVEISPDEVAELSLYETPDAPASDYRKESLNQH